ncbi:hypothetical protein B0H65DRAFT_211664 [Neurospora tetraspora]|uniref:Uncharacterized protein n=1 Tax=Neurospora tetraspora TaxID=94610 RepID=A0AAE0MTJ2_9PEZI|nr:hypothetical protein B0H65DRAFT_211664 [Neurospora tetraspora]
MTVESLSVNDPLLGVPLCRYKCYTTFLLSAAGHIQHRQVFALLRPSTVLAMPACSCRIDVETRWQITLGHLHGTHMPSPSQPASPPCRHAYQSHHQIGNKISVIRVHSQRTTAARSDSSLATPKRESVFPAANLSRAIGQII